ncbi:hypothetical protein [Cerasicoccus arenae]|uniref:Uncharacterized protein n=1 Tax=Cerasicoccus arenae TaxID=424488 RepID=A0A8J3GER9_9BACT|nr:hypothetical protein [Cerasicoccus arenae]MBK1857602.1 hypothetical protein [Cerasicoccus arenae]GHC05639.1 hypothetical protein GCM10007047_23230 [Cerasicoccus arenae]
MHIRKFYIGAFALLLALATFAQAQDFGRVVTTQFSAIGWDNAIRNVYYLNGDERIDLTIPNGAPSSLYECRANQPLVFYRDGPAGPDGATPTPIPVASTTLSAAAPPSLLLFFDQKNANVPYRIVSVKNEAQRSMQDIYQLYNISRHKIVAQFNEERISIDPGKQLIINSPNIDKPNFGVMMAIQADPKDSGDWKLVYKAFWPYRTGRSSLVFITDKQGRDDQISVRRFYVSTPTPPKS